MGRTVEKNVRSIRKLNKKNSIKSYVKKHAYKLNEKINIYMQLKSFPTPSPSLFQSVT